MELEELGCEEVISKRVALGLTLAYSRIPFQNMGSKSKVPPPSTFQISTPLDERDQRGSHGCSYRILASARETRTRSLRPRLRTVQRATWGLPWAAAGVLCGGGVIMANRLQERVEASAQWVFVPATRCFSKNMQ